MHNLGAKLIKASPKHAQGHLKKELNMTLCIERGNPVLPHTMLHAMDWLTAVCPLV